MSRGAPSLDEARAVLRENFGHADFRPGQAEILQAVLGGEDTLAVMPTGSGKSLLYQLPAAMGPGLVVVASPLISLMRDQLRARAARGARAAALHSAQDDSEAAAALDGVAAGRVRLLYAAPERLAQDATIGVLRRACVKLFAVDEAHCVSQWGHEFRPEYRALGDIARQLGGPPVLAVTATAGPRTRDDIAGALFSRAPKIFVRSFARPNLELAFRRRRGGLRQIVDALRPHAGQSGVVYCNSRRGTDVMAQALARLGFDALPYHAGLDAAARGAHQDAFYSRAGVVMVATIAFGMGVDKPDVRFVVHADLPSSIEGYYQEIGRAGRDGLPAQTLALFEPRDLALRFASPAATADDPVAEAEYARRKAMARLCVATGCRFQALLAEFGEDGAACGRCDHCRGGIFALPRRLAARALGWRAALESRLLAAAQGAEAEPPDPAPNGPAETATPLGVSIPAPMRIADERLLRELEAARRAIAVARGVAPRGVASDTLLRRLAIERPQAPGHPLFVEARTRPRDAEALLLAIARARGDAG